jgi:hypothetical protein
MKKKLFFLMFLVAYAGYSQDGIGCATEDNLQPDPQGVYSYSSNLTTIANAETKVFNVYFWQVREPDGSYPVNFNERILLEGVAELNKSFNYLNIFFKYRGYDGFNSPSGITEKLWNPVTQSCDVLGPDPDGWGKISRCQLNDLWLFAKDNGYYKADALNFYLPYEITDVGGAASSSYSIYKILVSIGGLSRTITLHELGHFFGLNHTNLGWDLEADPTASSYPCEGCEHVTRDINDPDYNANCIGDKVHDTNAVPDFYREHLVELLEAGVDTQTAYDTFIPFKYVDPVTCQYLGSGRDCIEKLYQINTDDTRNIMLNASNCSDRIFTPGQGVRMVEHIQTSTSLGALLTDVSALYEPYSGEYYNSGPFDSELHRPLFQPGFEYRFVECNGNYPQPADYYDVSFPFNQNNILLSITNTETDFRSITHPNHSAIRIDQEVNGVQVFPQPRKCYDNWNRRPNSGIVTKFNDGVLNTNVTVIPQDSTSINNPQLIQNLQPGLYKIDKVYNSGAVDQTVILKNNN